MQLPNWKLEYMKGTTSGRKQPLMGERKYQQPPDFGFSDQHLGTSNTTRSKLISLANHNVCVASDAQFIIISS
jgi:hypothetical protein